MKVKRIKLFLFALIVLTGAYMGKIAYAKSKSEAASKVAPSAPAPNLVSAEEAKIASSVSAANATSVAQIIQNLPPIPPATLNQFLEEAYEESGLKSAIEGGQK